MFRFLHAADVHLDSPLIGLDQDAPKDRIRDASRVALRRLVDLALEEKVDFLVLAGDIYDGDWPDYATGHEFLDQMRRLKPMPIFAIHGNHDALNKMTRTLTPPAHLDVFGAGKSEPRKLEHLHVAVHGRSFADQKTPANLVRDYSAPIPGYFNIGILHTSLEGAEGHDPYAPCSPEQLANHGYDYWALGHIHKRQIVREADPCIVFPGNLQGRHIRETGPKGAYLVEVDDDHRVAMKFCPLEDVRWETLDHTVQESDAVADILAAVASKAGALRVDGRLLVLRVRLHGECLAHEDLVARRQDHTEQLRGLLKDELGDDGWLEALRIQTKPRREAGAEENIEDARSEVAGVLAELRGDRAWLAKVAEQFKDLQSKLPRELFDGPDAPRLADVDWLAELLDRVPPTLFGERGSS